MGNSQMDEKLDKREIGELLELLGRALKYESDVSLQMFEDFLERSKSRRGIRGNLPVEYLDNSLEKAIFFISKLKGSDNIRDFLEISYKIPVPYKLGRSILTKLAVGVILTSKTNFEDMKLQWEKRENKIRSINPYQISKENFRELLLDDTLFPSGYSIISFAKKFHIRLPLTKDKSVLISRLMDMLFERPSGTRRIGNWGLEKKRETLNDDR
jgi:hypothetical protein